jgi:hypothetical protein
MLSEEPSPDCKGDIARMLAPSRAQREGATFVVSAGELELSAPRTAQRGVAEINAGKLI